MVGLTGLKIPGGDKPIAAKHRVLIVDDSRISRTFIESVINEEPDLQVVGSVFSGEKALEFLLSTTPDLITLDVEMPGLGGLETLEEIQRLNASLPPQEQIGVLMVSAYTPKMAEVTAAALRGGAYDFVTKPSTQIDATTPVVFRQELVFKLRKYLQQNRSHRPRKMPPPAPMSRPAVSANSSAIATESRSFEAILIGASTGGPRALADLLPALTAISSIPILIVQHLPVGFTRSLADNLQRYLPCPIQEAENGQPILPNNIYLASGGRHLTLARGGRGELIALLTDAPPESGCRPSASVLFRAAAAALGPKTLAIILTGMGNDGAKGLSELYHSGGYVIAQDEASSVVWGMPGSAVAEAAVHRILPLDLIAAHVATLTRSAVAG